MTVHTLDAGLPEITLPGGFVVKFEAISPTTGLAISGVSVSAISIYGYQADDSESDVPVPAPYLFVPGPAG